MVAFSNSEGGRILIGVTDAGDRFFDDRDGCLFTATVHRKTIDSSGKKVGKVGEKLSQNEQSIIEAIIHNPYVSARELSEIVGISSRKIEENIKKLKAQGVVKRLGPAKGGYWEIVKE